MKSTGLATHYHRGLGTQCVLIVLATIVIASASPSMATTWTVTSLADDGSPGTLRSQINNAAAGDTVNFGVSGTITLLQGTLGITKDLTISGPGAANLIISADTNAVFRRVISVDGGITAKLSGVTIANGAHYWGGGVYAAGAALTLRNTDFVNNGAYNEGGAIFGGDVTIIGSTFSGNGGYYGGAISDTGNLNISGSTFTGSSTNTGGAVINVNGVFAVTNSTFVNNSASSGATIVAYGSGTVTNSTFANNSGGALAGAVTVKSTLLANGSSGGNCSSGVTSAGHNLSDDNSCVNVFIQAGDLNNTPPGLDPAGLKNNGGPTQTIALTPGSAAIDAIPVTACTDTSGNPVTTDQRDTTRPQGPACDIGAFEEATPTATTMSTITSNFNGTAINAGSTIWFNSVLKASGLGTKPVTITVSNATVTFAASGTNYKVPVPNSTVTFSPTATTASTVYDAGTNTWHTTVPSSLGGNMFLAGAALPVTTNLPGGINPVAWSGNLSSDTPGVTVNWQWAAAVYSNFTTDYNVLGVKPVDNNSASTYQNSDHAGTPENYKSFLIPGARGGGGSNYTGGYSGTASVKF